jgi:hypothetical protein
VLVYENASQSLDSLRDPEAILHRHLQATGFGGGFVTEVKVGRLDGGAFVEGPREAERGDEKHRE